MKNNNYIKQIIKIFDNHQDLHIAHKKSEDIMKQIVEDKNFINEIVEYNLSQPEDPGKQGNHRNTFKMSKKIALRAL